MIENERLRIASNGNIGIGTNNPAGKLDIYGFIYSNGHKQPFSRNGTVSNSYNADFPTLFDSTDTTVHTCEIVFSWYLIGTSGATISIYGISSGGTGYNPQEAGYKDGAYNSSFTAQGAGNTIARSAEVSISSTTKIRITRQEGTLSSRSQYICDTIYCYNNVGTFQNVNIGWHNTGTGQVPTIRLQTLTAKFEGRWTATYYHV